MGEEPVGPGDGGLTEEGDVSETSTAAGLPTAPEVKSELLHAAPAKGELAGVPGSRPRGGKKVQQLGAKAIIPAVEGFEGSGQEVTERQGWLITPVGLRVTYYPRPSWLTTIDCG